MNFGGVRFSHSISIRSTRTVNFRGARVTRWMRSGNRRAGFASNDFVRIPVSGTLSSSCIVAVFRRPLRLSRYKRFSGAIGSVKHSTLYARGISPACRARGGS